MTRNVNRDLSKLQSGYILWFCGCGCGQPCTTHLIGTDASILTGVGGALINVLLTPAAKEKRGDLSGCVCSRSEGSMAT